MSKHEPRPPAGREPEATGQPEVHDVEALVRAVKADRDDGEAWKALYANIETRLKLIAASRPLPLGIELDDLVQEVVGYVYRSLDSYEKQPDATFHSWLLKIAENKIKDLWRRARAQKRDGAVLFRDYLNSQMSDPGFASSDPRASQLARANEIQALQDEAMQKLSDRHRQVIELRIEGLSYDEVAARMGYEKAGTVRALHNRAMERLRTLMDKVRESRGS